ncbi:MAG: DUF4197 domain-containing protein [Chitinophagales bacterium]|nr:DUF4197 domain-containing protein [Chitinophagales bacterium]
MKAFRLFFFCGLIAASLPLFAQKVPTGTGSTGTTTTNTSSNTSNISGDKVVDGLKEALNIATKTAAGNVSKTDGYFRNVLIKIPYPAEVKPVMDVAAKVPGGQKYVDDFVKSLNRAAEEAAKSAAPIFVDAVKQMTITDGMTILKGSSNEATMYLKSKTQEQLKAKYKPIVKSALAKVQVTKYWNKVASSYNKLPFVKKVNPNLEDYTTQKALDGLFLMIGKEEEKIRKDPAARVTDILRTVFGR